MTTTLPAGWPCSPLPSTVVRQASRGVPSAAQTTSSGVLVASWTPGAAAIALAAPACAGTFGTVDVTAASWAAAREESLSCRGVLVDDQVAADHREALVGAVEADVLGAVGVEDDVLDHEVLAGAEAEHPGVAGDVGAGLGYRGLARAGGGGGRTGGDDDADERGDDRDGSDREGAAGGGGGAHSDSSRGSCREKSWD